MQNKKPGAVAIITSMLLNLQSQPFNDNNFLRQKELLQRRSFLLTNGGVPPIPFKMLNQRQKRKRNRQINRFV